MIDFTIKTLDSNNHHFSVDDGITVQQLKEKVREQMGIEIPLQRLIFCGRVLQDENNLSDYGVQGKVVHLVQRPPPEVRQTMHSSNSSTNNTNTNTTHATMNDPNASLQQLIRRLMTMTTPEQQQQNNMPPTAGRLETLRRTVADIKTSLITLRAHLAGEGNSDATARGEPRVESADNNETTPTKESTQAQDGDLFDENGEEIIDPNLDAATRAQFSRRRAIRNMRARSARPRELTTYVHLLNELENLSQQFAPHRAAYINMLREANVTDPPLFLEEDREAHQRTVELICDIMHSFAHAYHVVSDIQFEVGQRRPRLTSEATPRHAIPVQAHINLVQSNRRQSPQQGNAGGGNAGATATQTSGASATGEANTQGTTEPPLPENPLFGGLATTVPNSQTTERTRRRHESHGNQAQANGDELHLVFVAQVPWVGAPSADLLQNIFSSVLRQAIVPAVEGVALQGHGVPIHNLTGMQIQAQMMQAQMAQQAQAQQAQAQQVQAQLAQAQQAQAQQLQAQLAQAQTRAQAEQAQQAQSQDDQNQPGQTQDQARALDPNANRNRIRQANLRLRRATATSFQAAALAHMFYDNYLHCESPYARRRLQRRREIHQRHIIAQERRRAERVAAQNIEILRERIPHLDDDHINTMLQLINGPVTPESWFNALLVTIARQLHITEPLVEATGEIPLVPLEFTQLRNLLRSYVQDLLERSHIENSDNAYQDAADYFLSQYTDFIIHLHALSPLRRGIDVLESVRVLIRARMPAVISSVTCNSTGIMYASRFYSTFGRFYTDLCAILTYACVDGVDGMRNIYEIFLEDHVQQFDITSRRLLTCLSMDNLEAITEILPSRISGIERYIRRRDGSMPSSWRRHDSSTPMNVSQFMVRDDPMFVSSRSALNNILPSAPVYDTRIELRPEPPYEDYPQPRSKPRREPRCDVHYQMRPEPRYGSQFEEPRRHGSNSEIMMPSTSSVRMSTRNATFTQTTAVQAPVVSPGFTNRASRTDIADTFTTSTVNSSSNENLRFVPPMVIVQHWGEEWVPVFTRDQNSRANPPEPYSDAYLSGMPSRKRRCIRQSRPPTTLDGFVNETVREVTERAPTGDNNALRHALREHMRSLARNRAANSEDFRPQRYTTAARFFESARAREQSTDNTEPNEEPQIKQNNNQ